MFSQSLPALDWQLPSSSGPYSLQIEVQPKSHHRAHYETEGSRGAVKALAGGHPVVQVFIYIFSEFLFSYIVSTIHISLHTVLLMFTGVFLACLAIQHNTIKIISPFLS